jgi:hypothetical protein
VQPVHARNHVFEKFFFPAQFLRALLVAPDVRALEFACDLDQALLLGIDVKGTSAARLGEPEGPPALRRFD